MNKIIPRLLLASSLILLSNPSFSAEKSVATERFGGTILSFEFKGSFSNATVSVSGPNGFFTSMSNKQGSPTIDLSADNQLDDGQYTYEISVMTDEKVPNTNKLDNGRGANSKAMINVGKKQSGSFRVENGSIVIPSNSSEGE